jgi:hypothetical protein
MAENRKIRAVSNVSTLKAPPAIFARALMFLMEAVVFMECGGHDQSAAPRKVKLHELAEAFDP